MRDKQTGRLLYILLIIARVPWLKRDARNIVPGGRIARPRADHAAINALTDREH